MQLSHLPADTPDCICCLFRTIIPCAEVCSAHGIAV